MATRDFVVRKLYVSGISYIGNPVSRVIVDRKPVKVNDGDAEADTLNAGILNGSGAPPLRMTYDDVNHPDLDGIAVNDITYCACTSSFTP